jgi:hypothetical protein
VSERYYYRIGDYWSEIYRKVRDDSNELYVRYERYDPRLKQWLEEDCACDPWFGHGNSTSRYHDEAEAWARIEELTLRNELLRRNKDGILFVVLRKHADHPAVTQEHTDEMNGQPLSGLQRVGCCHRRLHSAGPEWLVELVQRLSRCSRQPTRGMLKRVTAGWLLPCPPG